MDATVVSIIAACASACAIAAFVFARMKDAEERGKLIQRVTYLEDQNKKHNECMLSPRVEALEKNQDRHDGKIDKILEKLDFLASDLRSGFDSHVKEYHRPE